MKKTTKFVLYIVFILILLAVFTLFFVKNINERNKKIIDDTRYLIIGKNNLIAVYEDRLAIKIPYEIEIEKELTFGELVEKREYQKVLFAVNDILPEKLERYKIIKIGEVELSVKNSFNIPEARIDEKRHILKSYVDMLFKNYYKTLEDIQYSNVNISIINGNGITGYARGVGENLKKNLGINYVATTSLEEVNETEIIVNELSKNKVEEIIFLLNEKYIKIVDEPTKLTGENITIILGSDKKAKTEIEIVGIKSRIEKIEKKLKESGYEKLTMVEMSQIDAATKIDLEVIEYRKSNYYTALKLAKELGIISLVENNSIGNKIRIKIKE